MAHDRRSVTPTPLRILITVALLAVYSGLAAWIALSQPSWPLGIVALMAAAACVGTAMLKPWSQFLVYLLAAILLAPWGQSVYAAYRVGLFHVLSRAQLARLFGPDTLLVLLLCYCGWAVFRQFVRRPPPQPRPPKLR